MFQAHKISSLIITGLVFLLPLFFIPGGALDMDVAKSSLTALAVIVAVLVFIFEVWRKGEFSIPWSLVLVVAILLPIVYFLSAFLSVPSSLSLFGYGLEVGTFGFMLLGSVLLLLSSVIFTDSSKTIKALVAFFASFSLIAIFATVKIFYPDFLALGNFSGNTANPIGRWTDLATAMGLLSVFSILVIEMIPMKKSMRLLSYAVFALSTALLVVLNFTTAFIFTLVASAIIFVYFSIVEKNFFSATSPLSDTSRHPGLKTTFLPILLGVVSIIFLINPSVSSTQGSLSDMVSRTLNVSNTEVRPSFSATLSISRAALSQNTQNILLGSGPNTFSHDWLTYKPQEVNATPFWGVAFPFGIGFIPTQVVSIGVLGMVLWLAFFILLVILGVRALSRAPESRVLRFALVSSFVIVLYLWTASFLYPPSTAILILSFIFSGLFIATAREVGAVSSRNVALSRTVTSNFISTLLVLVVAFGSVVLGFVVCEKTLSSFHFNKALALSNVSGTSLETIEGSLNNAVKFAPADIHYVALSRINLAKAQNVAVSTTGTPEENRALFEDAISKSIAAAREAVTINPEGYQNWIALGAVYSVLVPAPLSVSGAYENATFAYAEASKKNPLNPEIPLFLARLELSRGEVEAARSLIRQSLVLKEDYADAHLMLAQLEVQQNNIAGAIASAERLAVIVPNNPAIYFELGLLKYSNKDYLGAGGAFVSALTLVPDYANAKYYLGLSLARLGRLDEAQRQFESLLATNPDNAEVQSIILELKAGKVSFLNK
ncbi:MAG: tetratricopeptide repeat protein [Minisyncoccia bacterium]